MQTCRRLRLPHKEGFSPACVFNVVKDKEDRPVKIVMEGQWDVTNFEDRVVFDRKITGEELCEVLSSLFEAKVSGKDLGK